MKKLAIIASIVVGSILLTVLLVIPAVAQDGTPPAANDAWQNMYQACQNGDWEAMQGAMNQVNPEDMPCHGAAGQGGMMNGAGGMMNGGGGMMGGGMMGGGMMRSY